MIEQRDRADLHLHTNLSDGYSSPRDLVDKLVSLGLQAIAITDHDEISTLPDTIYYGNANNLEVISGVELSVIFNGRDVHLLGYGFDPTHSALVDYLSNIRNDRIERARQTVDKLAELGAYISFDEVMTKAGSGSVGRPHIANVLLEYGLVISFKEAFDKYLGDGKPANIKKTGLHIGAALELIESAGGVCSIAHPVLKLDEQELLSLIKAGSKAIEVVHPKHNKEKTLYYRNVAHEYGLLETGGSDFHGGPKGAVTLGKYTVPYEVVRLLKGRCRYHRQGLETA